MTSGWHDINDPGFFFKKESDAPKTTDALTVEPSSNTEKEKPEVKLINATWQAGEKGFEFNKECYLEVKAEFLAKTSVRLVTAKLFVVFQGNTEDVHHACDGYLNDDGKPPALK